MLTWKNREIMAKNWKIWKKTNIFFVFWYKNWDVTLKNLPMKPASWGKYEFLVLCSINWFYFHVEREEWVTNLVKKLTLKHYRWFWDFWFRNCMGLKTSEMGCFTFQIIISNHKISFKKFHKKFENWQKISLILLTESRFSWSFLALY